MGKLRNKIIQSMLEKDGLVGVPNSWQSEYVKLAGDKVRLNQAIDEIMEAYNNLLKDNLTRCGIRELKEMIKEANAPIPKDATKEQLEEIAFIEYKMNRQ